MAKLNLLKDLSATIYIKCPECKNNLSVVGLSDSVLWCKTCKKAYHLTLIRSNKKEADLKDVIGFQSCK